MVNKRLSFLLLVRCFCAAFIMLCYLHICAKVHVSIKSIAFLVLTPVHRRITRKTSQSYVEESTTSTTRRKINNIETQLNSAIERAQKEVYTILLWEKLPKEPEPGPINRSLCGACEMIFDQRKINLASTKAVVYRYWQTPKLMPKERRNDQMQVWLSMEALPALFYSRNLTLKGLDNVFNLTMTYRRDSDVYCPFGTANALFTHWQKKSSGNPDFDIHNLVKKKQKLVLWVVSNCLYTPGAKKRLIYVYKLMQANHMVDKRGYCSIGRKMVKSIEIAKYYKFYLAFENSYHCRDYITEKAFINALKHGAVPVVWGAKKSDYEAILPPGSFIFADDYTINELVEYLNYLDHNNTAYKAYFQWRTLKISDMPMHNRTTGWCQLCRILHGINVDNLYNPKFKELHSFVQTIERPTLSRTVHSVRDWLIGTENDECIPGSASFKKTSLTF